MLNHEKHARPSSRKALLVVCSVYVLLALSIAHRFPPVNTDEVVRAVMGYHRIHGEPPRYSLYDDIFARPVYAMRDVLPDISLTIYHVWLGVWTSLKPSSYMSSRLSSVASGTLVLLMFYKLGARLGGTRMAVWSALLAGFNPLFLIASSLARPETLLLLTSTVLLWLTLDFPERLELKPFLIGGLGMLQMGVHPNASIICVGLFAFYLLNTRAHNRLAKGLLFAAGALAGLLTVLLLADARRLWLGLHTMHSYLLRPPILSWPWKPLEWLRQIAHVMWTGQSFYFDRTLAAGWPLSLQAWWLAMAMLVAIAGIRARRGAGVLELRRWMIAGLVTLVSSLVLVKAKECLYGTNFFPFLIPIAASAPARPNVPFGRVLKNLSCALAGFSLLLFFNFYRIYITRVKPYDQIVDELQAMLPNRHLKVAGPNVLWFGWDKENFRDSGALLLSHWYMGGQRDFQSWLQPWQPDILILDQPLINIFKRPVSEKRNLMPYINRPVDFLGVLDTQGAYGQWEVYQIHWRQTSSAAI